MHKRVSFKSEFYYIQGLGGYNQLLDGATVFIIVVNLLSSLCDSRGNRENIIKARHDLT